MRLTLLTLATLLSTAILLAHLAALQYSWYWTYWWFDILMHASGGALIVVLAVAALGLRPAALLIALAVGVGWEGFEVAIGLAAIEDRFVFDTTLDLFMDTLGAAGAYGMIAVWQFRSRLSAAPAASPDQTLS
ncbi:hypothetical protein KGO06_01830 [Patescibacteria group bacterium]|nr:hypothetical protein [Patescibacteria group bacterium]